MALTMASASLARLAARGLGQAHGDVGGEVAVGGIARALEPIAACECSGGQNADRRDRAAGSAADLVFRRLIPAAIECASLPDHISSCGSTSSDQCTRCASRSASTAGIQVGEKPLQPGARITFHQQLRMVSIRAADHRRRHRTEQPHAVQARAGPPRRRLRKRIAPSAVVSSRAAAPCGKRRPVCRCALGHRAGREAFIAVLSSVRSSG